MPVFVFGCVAALIHKKLQETELRGQYRLTLDGLAILVVAGLIIITPYPMERLFGIPAVTGNNYLINKFIFIGFACSILIISIVHGKWVKQLFATSFMRFFGKISYGGYLIHWIFVNFIIFQYFRGLTIYSGVLTFLLSVVSATILHYAIERPCMKLNLLKIKKINKLGLSQKV